MSIRTIALVAIVLNGIAASSAAPAHHLRGRNDCPVRMRRSVPSAGPTTGVGAKVVSSFIVSDLAAFTAAQAQAHAAPPAPTPAYGYQPEQQAGTNTWHDSQLSAVATGDFGDFFDTTGAAAATATPAATAAAGLTTGIGAKIVSSFTVSDLNSFTAAQAGASPAPTSTPEAKAGGAATTGVGAKVISSFTVTDLAAFTASASAKHNSAAPPAPTGTWAVAPTPVQGETMTGVGARVVCSFTVGAEVVASATAALGSHGAQPTAASTHMASAAAGTDAPAVSGAASSAAAPQSSRIKVSRTGTFSPTTTGLAAKPLGFATTSTVIAQAAPAGSSASPSASSGPPAPAPTTAPASDAPSSAASSSSASAPPAETPVAAAQEAAAEIPGQKLAVMPIGLGVFGAIAGLGMIVVGWVTWERKKYRKQFRARKETEALNDALKMRSSRMV